MTNSLLKKISLKAGAFILFLAFNVPCIAAEHPRPPVQEFVENVGNQIIRILVDQKSDFDTRQEKFRVVLRENFNIKSIAKFVIARYWRTLNEAQKDEFISLFENTLVENYSAQFNNYSNETLKVTNQQETKDGGFIIQSQVIRPAGGPPLNVDWKVFERKDGFKIYDIIVNGVSLSITQRSLYASTIQSNNNDINKLLNSMKDKNFHKALVKDSR